MRYKSMIFLPISINITTKKVMIVGGGRIAANKLALLTQFTDNITVLAPEIISEIKNANVNIVEKEFSTSDIEDFSLIYACTSDHCLNQKIKEEANARGILVNVVDNRDLCDFISPAIYKHDYLTIAVSSNGQNIRTAIKIRDRIKEIFENDKAFFLE